MVFPAVTLSFLFPFSSRITSFPTMPGYSATRHFEFAEFKLENIRLMFSSFSRKFAHAQLVTVSLESKKFAVVFSLFPIAIARSRQWSCRSSPFHFPNVAVSRLCRLSEFTLTGPLLNSRPCMFVLLDPYIRDSTFSLKLCLSLIDSSCTCFKMY